ncbi:MAG: glycosyltransferase, partial [bacterium]
AQHLVHLSLRLASAARKAGIPFVLSLHDYFFLCERLFLLDREGQRCEGPERGERCVACLTDVCAPVDARWRFAAMQEAFDCADAVVAPGPSLARRMVEAMPAVATRLRVVEPGIDAPSTVALPASAVRRRLGDPMRFLFVGGALPHKGLDLLIEACEGLGPDGWELSVRGGNAPDPALAGALRERSAGLPIRWQGRYAAGDAAAVFAAADVLVLPSRCDESWSRVVREARAAGCAVVASAAGGPADLLEHGRDALLVEPGSAPALGAALRRLLEEKGLCASLQGAETRIGTTVQAASELEQLFHELLGLPR